MAKAPRILDQDTVKGLKWPFDVKKEFQKAMAHPGLSKRTCVKLHFEVVQVVKMVEVQIKVQEMTRTSRQALQISMAGFLVK